VLRHKLYFNQADSKGDFILVMYWQAPSAEENFTLENVEVYWEDGPPMENVSIDNYPIVFQGDPGKRGWQVEVDGTSIQPNGNFYIESNLIGRWK
jgi:hypothetical protein